MMGRPVIDTRFFESRRKALLAALLDSVRRQPSEMLAFEAVRACLNIHGQVALGHQTVPVKHIVGSEGRYSDFDRRFLPRTEAVEQRWRSVERAMDRLIDLPPVDLWKISDVYFVRDGNHRVSVARWMGQGHIDAYVTELLVDVPLTPDLSVRTLLFAEEYNDFLEWTNLHALRPDERIEFSELGGYLELVRHINAYRYSLGQQLGRTIERDEAVAGWYDSVFLPIVQVIRQQHATTAVLSVNRPIRHRKLRPTHMLWRLGTPAGPTQSRPHYAGCCKILGDGYRNDTTHVNRPTAHAVDPLR
jgi:hypothetical protein